MDPFIGEIKIFSMNFAPRGWAFCSGSLIRIAQHTGLFAVIGHTYGGDGRDFALPNLQGSAPLGSGQGPGLSDRKIAEQVGNNTSSLFETQIPSHKHSLNVGRQPGSLQAPGGNYLGRSQEGNAYLGGQPNEYFDTSAIGSTGSSVDHNNMQPFLALNFCIALDGIMPKKPNAN